MSRSRIWLYTPFRYAGNQMKYFFDNDVVATGDPVGVPIGDLSLQEYERLFKDLTLKHIEEIFIICYAAHQDDIILVNDLNSNKVYIAKLTGDYIYKKELDNENKNSGFPHQRPVQWMLNKEGVSYNMMPTTLQTELHAPSTIKKLDESEIGFILSLANMESITPQFPELEQDNDLQYQALQVVKKHLNSKQPELQLRAAEIILNLKQKDHA